jgi:hypothetical protein
MTEDSDTPILWPIVRVSREELLKRFPPPAEPEFHVVDLDLFAGPGWDLVRATAERLRNEGDE